MAFPILLLGYWTLGRIAPGSGFEAAFGAGTLITGVWLAVRLLRRAMGHAIWRLRNRLLVTYLFISVLPFLLMLGLALGTGRLLARQVMVYLMAGELDRRVAGLQTATNSLVHTSPVSRPEVMKSMVELFYRERYPGIEILLHQSGRLLRYPADGSLPPPPDGWKPTSGVLARDGRFYIWSYATTESGDVTITAPLTREFLASLVPGLGLVDFAQPGMGRVGFSGVAAESRLPPAMNRFDGEFQWFATVPVWDWDHPGEPRQGFLNVSSRASAVAATIFNRKADLAQEGLVLLLIGGLAVFIVVEIISVIVGITMTRTITGAVHHLYEGTERVAAGDFSHRIQVNGKDQLAVLGESFNAMTANMERLLLVAHEKERLQSEIEIAREVQNQLYPRAMPASRTLRLAAVCKPARLISGDYYEYEAIRQTQIALAIGDVAGKGISAALLMATLQSSLRAQLQSWKEVAAAAANGSPGNNGSPAPVVSTSQIVGRLNAQLYSHTTPEKFATFCLGIYDEPTGSFSYTNAGHLPPLLVREGIPERLSVNGTVVGAFALSPYDESWVNLKSGDLLAFFTDGVTEPENEYGEMFGEDRLVDLISRNSHLAEDQIIELVIASVRQWTASEELQDDMTLLLARRV